jgi:hypothetical protein
MIPVQYPLSECNLDGWLSLHLEVSMQLSVLVCDIHLFDLYVLIIAHMSILPCSSGVQTILGCQEKKSWAYAIWFHGFN